MSRNMIICLLMVLVFFSSCYKEDVHRGRVPVAAIGDTFLYKDEVDMQYAVYGHGTDSASFYRSYVERWALEHLFYLKATENVVLTDDIEGMVERYRRGLILSLYQDRLIDQQLVPDISRGDISEFYKENEAMFELEEPILKGSMLKVSDKAPHINKVRTWFVRKSVDDYEQIEKYSIANSALYDNFQEEWRTMADISRKLPITEFQLNERLKKRATIEFKDAGYIYFVTADTIIQKGETKPLEMVSSEIIDLLVNSRKAQFVKEKKNSLYNDALTAGEITFF